MAFMLIGLAMLGLWYLEIDPVASWPWWGIGIPFVLAVVWWTLSDSLGLTQARAMRKAERRQIERREKTIRDLGMMPKPGSHSSKAAPTRKP